MAADPKAQRNLFEFLQTLDGQLTVASRGAARGSAEEKKLVDIFEGIDDMRRAARESGAGGIRSYLADGNATRIPANMSEQIVRNLDAASAGTMSAEDVRVQIVAKGLKRDWPKMFPAAAGLERTGTVPPPAAPPVPPAAAPVPPTATPPAPPTAPTGVFTAHAAPPAGTGLAAKWNGLSTPRKGGLVALAIAGLGALVFGASKVDVPESLKNLMERDDTPVSVAPRDEGDINNRNGPEFRGDVKASKGKAYVSMANLELSNKIQFDPKVRAQLGLDLKQANTLMGVLDSSDSQARVVNNINEGNSSVTVRVPPGSVLPDKDFKVSYARDQISIIAGDDAPVSIETSPMLRRIFDTGSAAKPASAPAPGPK